VTEPGLAHTPASEVPVPDEVRRLAAGAPTRTAWHNEVGGLTFEVLDSDNHRFIKWSPAGCGISLAEEARRLEWAAPHTTVPRVLDHGGDADGEWLVTVAIEGQSAVSPHWQARPRQAAAAIGAGLRALHERLPVNDCPFVVEALARPEALFDPAAWADRSHWHAEHQSLSNAGVLRRLREAPPPEHRVVCHGDACAPNTIIAPDGSPAGHVDLGSLGVGDPWLDLAVGSWSLDWNFGPGAQGELFAAYGIDPDPERIAYYRLLWDLLG
jgi:kanamycin kinase